MIYVVCNTRSNSLLLNQGFLTYLRITIVSCKKSYSPIEAHSRCSAYIKRIRLLKSSGIKNTWTAHLESIMLLISRRWNKKPSRGEKQKDDNWKDELKTLYLVLRTLELFYFLHFPNIKSVITPGFKNKGNTCPKNWETSYGSENRMTFERRKSVYYACAACSSSGCSLK